MKYYYDLHIHSVLSPCGDYIMTPNNILNMSMLNELDIVAITDHNSLLQLDTINKLSESYDFLVVYGCELQVEGGHLLVYFKNICDARHFQTVLEKYLVKESYDDELYGKQAVCNVFDEEVYYLDYHLVHDLSVSLDEILLKLDAFECLKVLAHVDKSKYSLLDVIDERLCVKIDAIEICDTSNLTDIYRACPWLKNKYVLKNSDAHFITDINEKTNFIELEKNCVDELFKVIRNE